MFLFLPTALYNGVVTETNLPLLLLRSTKCDDENREAHAASPPKGMRNKREREETNRDPHSNSTKIKTSKLADRRTQKKGIVNEKNKNSQTDYECFRNRRVRFTHKLHKEIQTHAATTKERSSSDVGKKKHEEERARTRARQRENIIGRAAAASEWTVAMVYGPRAKSL
jgi:hypothetical protein